MTAAQRFGAFTVLVGGCLVVAAGLLVAVPLGLLVAGLLFALLGTVVLRGARP